MMMKDNRNTPSMTSHSSNTMEETACRPSAATDSPDKFDGEKPTTVDDGESNKRPEDEETTQEKQGSLKDYFVSWG
jgi:hypothetical protein